MDITINARIRKILEAIDKEVPGQPAELVTSNQLELLIAPGASPYGEITRIGRAFVVNTTAAIAAVVAIPTTACFSSSNVSKYRTSKRSNSSRFWIKY
jgi:hypothetical protein